MRYSNRIGIGYACSWTCCEVTGHLLSSMSSRVHKEGTDFYCSSLATKSHSTGRCVSIFVCLVEATVLCLRMCVHVQAAIGSIAFDKAKECSLGKECEGYKELGKKLVTVSFLVIVMCAPIGAAAIQFSGPHLLRREQSAGLNSSVNDMVGSAENGRSLGQNKSANNTRVDVNGMETSV